MILASVNQGSTLGSNPYEFPRFWLVSFDEGAASGTRSVVAAGNGLKVEGSCL